MVGNFLDFAKTLMDEFTMDINDDHKQAQNVYCEEKQIVPMIKQNAIVKSVSTQTISSKLKKYLKEIFYLN